jgi:FMN phosphatase YigB (HAD superfamily)
MYGTSGGGRRHDRRVLRVVLLDVGGTLWPNTWPHRRADDEERVLRLRQRVPALTGREASEIVTALSRVEHPATPRQQTELLVLEAVRRVNPRTALRAADVIAAMCLPARGRVQPFAGTKDLLEGLADRDVRVVVVSNVLWRGSHDQRRDFYDFALSDGVAAYVSSLDVGWRKPHAAFFEAASVAARHPPCQCVMVGDSEPNDIVPACRRGMRTVRVAIEAPLRSTTVADEVCTSLHEVAAILFDWLVDGRTTG